MSGIKQCHCILILARDHLYHEMDMSTTNEWKHVYIYVGIIVSCAAMNEWVAVSCKMRFF